MSVSPDAIPFRERRRAATSAEIKAAAIAQLAQSGAGALSLRAVAREMGMTVQALYHYFDSRDALLSALVADAHHALADAIEEVVVDTRGQPSLHRRLTANRAYRRWALAHREEFLLIFGAPVPGFAPTPEAHTGEAAQRLARPFFEVVFDGWTDEDLASVGWPDGADPVQVPEPVLVPAPAPATALFIELRGRLHGIVILEVTGHLHPLQGQGSELLDAATCRLSAELDALQGRPRPDPRPAV